MRGRRRRSVRSALLRCGARTTFLPEASFRCYRAVQGLLFEDLDLDEGEVRQVAEAIDLNVPAPIITLALISRLQSRDHEAFSNRLLAALRHEFGGHQFAARD